MSVAVVVGAGATGTRVARLLAERGREVRLISRRGSGPLHPRIELMAVDATDAAALAAASAGASVLFQCAMPAYDRWLEEFPPLSSALLTAARHSGARYVMLGNVYGYGSVPGPMHEQLPMAPSSRKGELRARLWEEALRSAVQVSEVRASDFVGRGAVSLFTLMVAPQLLAGQPARVPADLDVAHSWSHVDDVARTLVAASDSEQWGRAWHVPSHTLSVRQLAESFAALAAVPCALLSMSDAELAAFGDPILNEVVEMTYLLRAPLVLDSAYTERELGVAATPLHEVLLDTLADLRARG